LQRLGLVLHVSPSRKIIVKVQHTPRIGETVVDENLKPVGRVFDIIGPVSAPYAAISPSSREFERLVNKTIYVLPSKRERRRIDSE
jgi:rRNA processing protein Gar1